MWYLEALGFHCGSLARTSDFQLDIISRREEGAERMLNMTRIVGGVSLLLFTMCGVLGLAQVPKIGFVNSQQVLYGTEEGKAGLAELENYMAQQREAFEAKNSELAKMQEEFMAQQRTMNADAAATAERAIQQKEVELRRFQEDAQADFTARQNQVLQTISEKIQVIIQEYAQSNNYSAIFLRDQNQIYVAAALDVTEQIIGIYNQRYSKASAETAPAATN